MTEASRYKALRKIADGGSAEVFLAEQAGAAGFKRHVVLKRIRPALSADEQFRAMLIDEANLAMSLRHPNLVEVLDVGDAAGKLFLVLELVDGWTLAQLVKRGRKANFPMPPELAVYVAAEVCRGLAYAHARTRDGKPLHIVHRDICPNNVLVSMHAEVKIADFGIAQGGERLLQTQSGMIRGKPAFMSPEQTRAEPLDARSDLFSVGTLLYSLLTDTHPFPGPGDRETLGQVATQEAPPVNTVVPALPEEVAALVQHAMKKKREERFQSADDMLAALEKLQRGVLKPAGRSELENYLRALSAKDGETAITRQTMPPAKIDDEPEWISLSAEQAVVTDQTETQRALPIFDKSKVVAAAESAPRQPSAEPARWPAFLAAMLITGAVVWFLQNRARPGEAAVPDAGALPIAAPVIDAGPPPVAVAEANDTVDAAVEPTPSTDVVVDATPIDAGQVEVPIDAPEPDAGAAPSSAVSRSGTPSLKLTAKLAPNQPEGSKMVAVLIDSEPSGVTIRVEKRVLGTTPALLHFKGGFTFDVWFEAEGQPPLRQWLMLTEKAGKPRVTLRTPVE
ncbi:MAG: protein kinase [Myxococcaceae bacterium]